MTNYYWYPPPEERGQYDLLETQGLHVGKDVSGWAFMLKVYPDLDIQNINDWNEKLDTGSLEDEEGNPVSKPFLNDLINVRTIHYRQPISSDTCIGRSVSCDYMICEFN